MNKAVIIVMLFCVSSFTGCIGGDESSGLEVLDQDEQIELLAKHFDIKTVNEQSLDDIRNKDRKLLFCEK